MLKRLPIPEWLHNLHCPRHGDTELEYIDGQVVCERCQSPFEILPDDIIDLVAKDLLDEDASRELEEHSYSMTAQEVTAWVLSERAQLWKDYYSLDRQPGIRKLAQYLEPYGKEKIYFLGAGTGREIEYLLQDRSFDQIICSDISPSCLKVIPVRLAPYPVELGMFASDLNHIPVRDTDAPVVVVNALHHTADMHRAIDAMLSFGYPQVFLIEPTGNFLINCLEKLGMARRVEYSGVKPGRLEIKRLTEICASQGYTLELTTMWSFPQDYYRRIELNSPYFVHAFLALVRVFSKITAPFKFGNTTIACIKRADEQQSHAQKPRAHKKHRAKDPNTYVPHRAALAPLVPGAGMRELQQSLKSMTTIGEQAFGQFLIEQGLASLWDELLQKHAGEVETSTELKALLRESHLHTTAGYLIQKHNLEKIREILDQANIQHVVMKGAHTREAYYDTPAMRPAQDIDILVRPQDQITAIKTFLHQGYQFAALPENISHECTLWKGKTSIDLHWDILRPGRTRHIMVDALLEARVDYHSHWGMSANGTLFMMLVHPVFAKYSTTPHANLVRLLDLVYLLDKQPLAAEQTLPLLERAGLKTAGWITARWLNTLTGNAQAEQLAAALQPGEPRRRWLQNWLDHDRSSRLLAQPWAIQLGFTLPAHDRWSDALRATRQAWHSRKEGPKALALLEQNLA